MPKINPKLYLLISNLQLYVKIKFSICIVIKREITGIVNSMFNILNLNR